MKTILLVEDHPMVREYLTKLLHHSGFNVETAENGRIGRQKIEQFSQNGNLPRLVISDIEMPEMNGLQFAKWLMGFIPGIPILLMSGAHATYEHQVTALGLPFMPKPPNPDTFMLKVIELLGTK
jgi:DNA-binding response OmpR family regulator